MSTWRPSPEGMSLGPRLGRRASRRTYGKRSRRCGTGFAPPLRPTKHRWLVRARPKSPSFAQRL
eukprot:6721310-Alexandrium_andersonii.AAC.1